MSRRHRLSASEIRGNKALLADAERLAHGRKGGQAGIPPPVIPAYRTNMPPNQAAPTTTGFKGFLNCASNGANMPVASSLVTVTNRRVIDTYATPEWWFAWSMMFPAETPWTTSGLGTWCVYPLNFHAMGVGTNWGSGSGGGAGWGFAFVSPILMFESVADTPVGGNRPLDLALHQEDGQSHLNITMPFTLVHGQWNHFLAHIVFGLSSSARWAGVVNPSPTQRIGKVEIWKDIDIVLAPASPTWAMDPVGTLRAGVDPADSQRYCQRAIDIYEAQLYTPSYTESPLNPTSIISRANYRVVRCGQTLAACLAEVPSFTIVTDSSTWQGHVNKGGSGANLGDATRTVIADPGGYPR